MACCAPPTAGQYPQISDDLVNSHSLLLCCMDTLYNAVLLVDRRDLLNTVSLKNGEQGTSGFALLQSHVPHLLLFPLLCICVVFSAACGL